MNNKKESGVSELITLVQSKKNKLEIYIYNMTKTLLSRFYIKKIK